MGETFGRKKTQRTCDVGNSGRQEEPFGIITQSAVFGEIPHKTFPNLGNGMEVEKYILKGAISFVPGF